MLKLSYSDYEALRAHGEETYPHECCGALLGNATPDGNRVHQIVRAGNTRTDRAHDRYNIAPEELIKIQRQARGLGFDIVGFYHSHPDCPAQWSQDRLRRSPLGRLFLHHHPRQPRQGRRHQFVPAHRHGRGR
jgi:proteasome lid subunit RPN8/RPN11